MPALFPSPKLPKPPKPVDKQAQQAVEDEAARRRQSRGFQSTVLSQMLSSGLKTTFGG